MHVDSVRRIVRKVASQLATLSESERPGGPRLATDLDA